MRNSAFCCVLLLLCPQVLAAPVRHEAGGYAFHTAPTPAWVREQALPAPGAAPDAGSGARLRLVDRQYLLTRQGLTYFRKLVFRVVNQAGIDYVSNLTIDFSPDYQKLVIHEVNVVRGGKRESRLQPATVRLTQNERDLDRQVFRGMVSASVFVRNVRVGDEVEFSVSIEGVNPVYENRLNLSVPLSFTIPADAVRVRLRATTGKPYRVRLLETDAKPVEASGDGFIETSVAIDHVPGFIPDYTGTHRGMYPMVQFADFADWDDVAAWARRLFEGSASLPPELRERVKTWSKAAGGKREMARLATQYVQREITYVSVSIGENSHRPATPETVFRRGFGDCKDKTLLLAVLLREMGMKAWPVLVSAEFGGSVASMLPGPHVFDHAITMLELDGQHYWLDGTAQFQGGPLSDRYAGFYGFGLVAGAKPPSLVAVEPPPGYRAYFQGVHRFRIDNFARPVQLSTEGTSFSLRADNMRSYMQSAGREEFDKWLDSNIRQLYPAAEREGEFEVQDDEAVNRFIVKGRFALPEFFHRENGRLEASVLPTSLMALLRTTDPEEKKGPVAITHPETVEHSLVVEFPEEVSIPTLDPVVLENEYRRFRIEQRYDKKRLVIDYRYDSRREQVPAAAVAADNEFLKRVQRRAVVTFAVPILAREAVAAGDGRDRKAALSIARLIDDENLESVEKLTAEIQSGRLSRKLLARAYIDRAWRLERVERFSEAVADVRRALELEPDNPDALETLAADLAIQRRHDEALEAYRVAEAALPDNQALFYGRGRHYYYAGNFAEAEKDFRRALGVAKASGQSYILAWLYMAASRSGKDGRKTVEEYLSGSSRPEWPGPVVTMLLGRSTPDEVLAIAKRADERTAAMQLCEAWFFIGQHHLLQGRADKATRAFQQARDTGIRQYLEYQYSGWELEALKAKP